MPVFDAKNLDRAFEGQALLVAILHPTRVQQARALRHGRQRAERSASLADPMTIEPRYPAIDGEIAPTSCATR